jgi:hypothetical protein
MTDHRRIALHLNNLATILQQLAVELTEQAEHPAQVSVEELRRQLAAPVDSRSAAQRLVEDHYAGPPASVAEPECGCSLYTRCDQHAADKRCKCNGPDYRSSACLVLAHNQEAHDRPDRDPALAD